MMNAQKLTATALLAVCLVASSCKEAPLEERLRQPENFLVFEYGDFGPAIFTSPMLAGQDHGRDDESRRAASPVPRRRAPKEGYFFFFLAVFFSSFSFIFFSGTATTSVA